jgi:hypothetical protein
MSCSKGGAMGHSAMLVGPVWGTCVGHMRSDQIFLLGSKGQDHQKDRAEDAVL